MTSQEKGNNNNNNSDNDGCGPWAGMEEASPTEILRMFVKRFPSVDSADIAKFGRVVGLGDSVVAEFLSQNGYGKVYPGKANSNAPYVGCAEEMV